MTTSIYADFFFEAAHRLPSVPSGHKCGLMHGHSYRVRVRVTGPVHPEFGWIVDFADIAEAFKARVGYLDHRILNDYIANPTTEELAAWILREMRKATPLVDGIEVLEGRKHRCRVEA